MCIYTRTHVLSLSRTFRHALIAILFLMATSSVIAQQVIIEAPPAVTIHQPTPHNPTKAVLLSLIPGAGQIYNGQAWKIPIIYGALGGVGYFVYDYYTNMSAFKMNTFTVSTSGTPNSKDTPTIRSAAYTIFTNRTIKTSNSSLSYLQQSTGSTLSMPTSSGTSTTSRSTTTSPSTSRPPSPPTSATFGARPLPATDFAFLTILNRIND